MGGGTAGGTIAAPADAKPGIASNSRIFASTISFAPAGAAPSGGIVAANGPAASVFAPSRTVRNFATAGTARAWSSASIISTRQRISAAGACSSHARTVTAPAASFMAVSAFTAASAGGSPIQANMRSGGSGSAAGRKRSAPGWASRVSSTSMARMISLKSRSG